MMLMESLLIASHNATHLMALSPLRGVVSLEMFPFLLWVEYIATFACGVVGGIAALRTERDAVGIMVCAFITSVAGGVMRDLVIGAIPPAGLSDPGLITAGLLSGVAVIFFAPEAERHEWILTLFDAIALGMFATIGAEKALIWDMPFITAVFCGLITALGGGVVRDAMLSRMPLILRDPHWYAFPAAIGAVGGAAIRVMRQDNVINLLSGVALDIVLIIFVVLLRMLSLKYDLVMPGALNRTEPFSLRKTVYVVRKKRAQKREEKKVLSPEEYKRKKQEAKKEKGPVWRRAREEYVEGDPSYSGVSHKGKKE